MTFLNISSRNVVLTRLAGSSSEEHASRSAISLLGDIAVITVIQEIICIEDLLFIEQSELPVMMIKW